MLHNPKRSLFIIGSILLLVAIPSIVSAQSAKDALRALSKLQAKTEVGISLRDYRNELGDVKFEVDLFLKSKEAGKNTELANHIKKAMYTYLDALRVWDSEYGIDGEFQFLDIESEFGKELIEKYPDAKKDILQGGAIFNLKDLLKEGAEIPDDLKKQVIGHDVMLRIIWAKASKEIDLATQILAEEH